MKVTVENTTLPDVEINLADAKPGTILIATAWPTYVQCQKDDVLVVTCDEYTNLTQRVWGLKKQNGFRGRQLRPGEAVKIQEV